MDPRRMVQGLALQLTGVGLSVVAMLVMPRRRFFYHCADAACSVETRALALAFALGGLAAILIYVGHRLDRRY